MKLSLRWLYPTAFWCLLLSGAAALVYQVAWARYLSLLLGHTSYAVVAVLVAFMGGLALGNAWLGRYADRLRRPLALYAWLEVGIALYAVLFPLYFEGCRSAFVGLARQMAAGSGWLLVLKFVFSFAAILLPATLMGGTLPVLTRLVTRSLGELRPRVAGLYFVNSLGAVVGVAIADFWWIPSLGLEATVYGAAALNAVVGALALVMNAAIPDAEVEPANPSEEAVAEVPARSDGEETFTPYELRLAVLAAGVSGFVAMLYEVVWTRLLGLALGSSTHAFSIMLITFISGIAIGAYAIGRWQGLRRTFDAFGWAELALAGTLLGSMFFYHLLPLAFSRLGEIVARSPSNHVVYQGLQFLVCFAVMFVPAFCLGTTLPLASRVATSEVARTGRSVGLVFSVNTLGTVLGAAVTGLILLPWLGLAKTLALGVGLNLAIAVAVLVRRSERARKVAILGAPFVVLGLVLLTHAVIGGTWDRAFALGLWRVQPGTPRTLDEYRQAVKNLDVVYHRDGAGSTVVVHAWKPTPDAAQADLTLRVNGKIDATSRGDVPTQLLAGHLPMLLHPEATEVLVVGIGSGMTCGAILTHPGVTKLDVVEISPEVRHAAQVYFAPYNKRALEDQRTEVFIDDAKSFLAATDQRYDIIVSEPSNPWMAGVSGVFSLEYYETCRDRLRPGGVMAQWVQAYETDDRTLQTVLATFSGVFPFVTVWQTLPNDLLLIGSVTPIPRDLEAMQRRFDVPSVTSNLREMDLFTLPVLLSCQLVSESNGAFLAPPDAIRHSDFFPVLEYQAERAFFARSGSRWLADLDERNLLRPDTYLGEYLRQRPLTAEDFQAAALFFNTHDVPYPRYMRSLVEAWRARLPDSMLATEFSSKLEYPLPVAALEADRMATVREQMWAASPTELEPLRMYSRHLMNAYRALRSSFHRPPSEELERVLERLAETDSLHRRSHLVRLAEIAWDRGDDEGMLRLAAEAFRPESAGGPPPRLDFDFAGPGEVLFRVIDTLWRQRRFAEALSWCEAVEVGGYLDSRNRLYSSRLDVVVRKVRATLGEDAPATATSAPSRP